MISRFVYPGCGTRACTYVRAQFGAGCDACRFPCARGAVCADESVPPVSRARHADHREHATRARNSDTLYLSGWFDLRDEPVIVRAPDTDGRY
ncbi:MAG: DUF1254 domain-containing protein [Gammaproteobacteria bacterium]|nr:DUF1254 domain-containing protein [Gammaproteobacteria bacterium]